ncbi:MAG: hypothetical protein RL095_3469 [Verrucomicrobiota bacterium]|jgi:hypothetical protein
MKISRWLFLLLMCAAQILSAATLSAPDAAPGANITVTYGGITSPTSNDWIGIYSSSAGAAGSGNHSLLWKYTGGTASGNVTFIAPTLPAGAYQARLFANDGYTLLASANFNIASPPTGPTLSCANVATGANIVANYSGIASPAAKDWIGIYAAGAGNGSYLLWKYTAGAASGSITFSSPTLAAGSYQARLFANDGYTLLASANFTITAPPSGPAISATVSGSNITGSYSGIAAPTSSDWIGLYRSGAANDDYLDYKYTNGTGSGSVNFSALGLSSGTYQIRVFANDGYTQLAGTSFNLVVPAVTPAQQVFISGESLVFACSNIPSGSWIGIYAEGATDVNYLESANLSQSNGIQSFAALPAGYYEARVFTGSFNLVAKSKFRVRDEYRKATHVSLPYNGQTHGIGLLQAASGGFDQLWSASSGQSGLMSSTLASGLRQGHYAGIVQLRHNAPAGTILGTLKALQNGSVVASVPVTAETIAVTSVADFQYAKVDLLLPASGDVELQFHSSGNVPVANGVMSLFRTDDKKPIYLYAHRRNNILRLNDSVAQKANAVECDIRPVQTVSGIKFEVHHHSKEIDWTQVADVPAFLADFKQKIDAGTMIQLYFDCKDSSFNYSSTSGYSWDQYALDLLTLAKNAGIPANRIVCGTNFPAIFRSAATSLNYNVLIDSYFWTSGRYPGWLDEAEKYGELQEFDFSSSNAAVMEVTERIVNRGLIKKFYGWTIVNNASYYDNTFSSFLSAAETQAKCKSLMVLGMDGYMADDTEPIDEIMSQSVFREVFRKATAADDARAIHGETGP